jgi:probable addiction module antidote protein
MTTKQAAKRRTSDYRDFLRKRLQDPSVAAGYLTACLAEGEAAFLVAVKDVAEARGGITPLARRTKLNREGLYDMLSEKGNPRLSSLSAIIDALDMELHFTPKGENVKT